MHDAGMKILGSDFSDRSTSAYSAAWVEKWLIELEAHMPRMHRECSAIEFWQWVKGETDSVQRCLCAEDDKQALRLKIDAIVKSQIRGLRH